MTAFNAPRIIGGGQIQQPHLVDTVGDVAQSLKDDMRWDQEFRESQKRYDHTAAERAQERNLLNKWRLQYHRDEAFRAYEKAPPTREVNGQTEEIPFDEWYKNEYPDIQSEFSKVQMSQDYAAWRDAYVNPNPLSIFKKIYYDDKKTNYKELDISEYDKTFVKLFVVNKSKEEMFDKFINRLHTEIDLHEINIIDEDHSDITASVREDILDQGEDTLTFLGNYIEQIDTDLDRQQLKDFINKLYKEALE